MNWKEDRERCGWCVGDPLYERYHDEEWGREVTDDRTMFEFLTLESAQAGLSWLTILRRREHYRRAFAGFDPEKVAAFTETDVERLLQDPGIIRNRRKIAAAVNNARIFRDIQDSYGSFADYLWGWTAGEVIVESGISSSALSDAISADLKRRGMKFVGTTIIYAYLQAVGVIDAHEESCAWNRKNKGE